MKNGRWKMEKLRGSAIANHRWTLITMDFGMFSRDARNFFKSVSHCGSFLLIVALLRHMETLRRHRRDTFLG
jgi:hypothetical protein